MADLRDLKRRRRRIDGAGNLDLEKPGGTRDDA
jgi:hypothetical protein